MWSELVMGNRKGELLMSDEQAALIHDRLTHLTSEDLVRHRVQDQTLDHSNPSQQEVLENTVWSQGFLRFLIRRCSSSSSPPPPLLLSSSSSRVLTWTGTSLPVTPRSWRTVTGFQRTAPASHASMETHSDPLRW